MEQKIKQTKEIKINKPQFILTKSKVWEKIDLLKKHFDAISFSWKTNTNVGKVLLEKNENMFSIISLNELKQFLVQSSDVDRVLYFPFTLNQDELIFLKEKKIQNFVVENEEDLEKLITFVDKNNYKVNIQLRMKLKENTMFTGKHYVFGMTLNQIETWVPKLKENKNIGRIGIHFHRKTQNVSEWSLKYEVEKSLADILPMIQEINLGGGLPANYHNIHDKSIENIFVKIKELKDYTDTFGIKLIIEPGRFIAAPSVRLNSQIIQIIDNTCFLNCSIFNGTMDTVLANVKLKVVGELESGKKYLLKGCTPDSTDILRYSVYLDNPKVGDVITFENCGAYTYQTNFCALEHIEYLIED
ncbi:MAG: decarboxylase [Nanoarchaeales archaeon]|nr:decarboxylase [Nanoarchaeales archaeon]